MGQVRIVSRRLWLGWAVPSAVVVVAGGVLAGTVLASAAPPTLPHRTPAQLLAALRQVTVPAAMTAVISESASLGLPALPDIPGMSSSPLSVTSLLTGSHTVQVWYAGPARVRIAVPVSFGETDLRVNGNQVWLWDSQGQKATRYIVAAPKGAGQAAKRAAPGASAPARAPAKNPFAGMTPLQAAQQLLAMVGKTTRVTVPGTVQIAGRPAYQLVIAPRSAQSLIGRIVIAVDARTHLPLDVQVFARGGSGPAFNVGFTSLSFARPAMSNFAFTPPPGAHVKTVRLSAPAIMPWSASAMPGSGQPGSGQPGSGQPGSGQPGSGQPGSGQPAGVQVLGTGWLTVAAISASQLPPLGSAPKGSAPLGSALPGLLLRAATPVHGSWGSGRLLRTSLLSVLITSKGQVLAGAVTPAVLYADVAKVK